MMSKLLRAALAGLLASGCLGFLLPPLPLSPTRFPAARGTFRLRAEAAGAEGGGAGHSKATNMRVSEIKSELDLRKVPYNDCFDKESLVERLMEARARGAADTDILNSFTKTNLESQFDQDLADRLNNVDEGALKDVISSDGTLPGGLTPEETLNMMKNPEMRALLQSPKMGEIMKAMMSGGPDAMKQFMDDPEAVELLQKLNKVMGV